jgi:hypothetical protein
LLETNEGMMRYLDESNQLGNFASNDLFRMLPRVSGQDMVRRMQAAGYDSIIAEINLEDVMLGAASDGLMTTGVTRAGSALDDGIEGLQEYRRMLKEQITERTGQEAPDVVRYLNVFEPEKIRSPQARFDPDKRKSRDLLAALSGLGLGGAAMSQAATNRGMTDGA